MTLSGQQQRTPQFDLQHLSDADTEALRGVLASIGGAAAGGPAAATRQAVAERLVVELFNCLRMGPAGEPACALVRCFQTATYARMPLHYQFAADHLLGTVQAQTLDQMRCLALLATRGVKSVWNDVLTSVAHQAIPLPSVEVVQKAPMIARLFDQLGMSIERAVAPPDSPDFVLGTVPSAFRVFHIAEAQGSPFIPAQSTFVEPHGVRSVVGMGGVLPEGELIAVVMFARVPVSKAVAERFGSLAETVRSLVQPFAPQHTFGGLDVEATSF